MPGVTPFIRRSHTGTPLHPLVKAAFALFFSALFLWLILLTGRPAASAAIPPQSDTPSPPAKAKPL